MDLGLRDKAALVSGSTRGIGLAIAEELLAEGARVAVTGRDAARVREVSQNLGGKYGKDRVLGLPADFTAGDDVVLTVLRTAQQHFGGLDIVVANVGAGRGTPALEADVAEWERMLGLNLVSAAVTARHAASFLPAAGGSIILVGSIAGM